MGRAKLLPGRQNRLDKRDVVSISHTLANKVATTAFGTREETCEGTYDRNAV